MVVVVEEAEAVRITGVEAGEVVPVTMAVVVVRIIIGGALAAEEGVTEEHLVIKDPATTDGETTTSRTISTGTMEDHRMLWSSCT